MDLALFSIDLPFSGKIWFALLASSHRREQNENTGERDPSVAHGDPPF
jgi:hypothetical protein